MLTDIFWLLCIHRVTYSPVYEKNKSVWPNMSRPRLRNYGQPCGDLRASSSSYSTTESSAAHAMHGNFGLCGLLYSSSTCITPVIFCTRLKFGFSTSDERIWIQILSESESVSGFSKKLHSINESEFGFGFGESCLNPFHLRRDVDEC